jgi:outer membrane protein TolC
MGEPAGTTYTTDSAHIAGNRETGNEEVNNERLDFMALEKAMKSYELLIQSSKLNFLPKLNAVASYQRHDKTAPGFGTSAYFTGIQLSWSLFNGNRTKHIVSQQLLEKEKLATQLDQQKREAQAQIYRVTRQMNDASFGMDQQQLAIEQASDALRVVQNRFVQGLVKTTDVLMAQTQLAQQKIGYARALFEYNLAAASLLFLTTGK